MEFQYFLQAASQSLFFVKLSVSPILVLFPLNAVLVDLLSRISHILLPRILSFKFRLSLIFYSFKSLDSL